MELELLSYCENKSGLKSQNIQSVIHLLKKENCTVPFIARYRKEATGNLTETEIRLIEKSADEFEELFKRRTFILEKIKEAGGLTPELEKHILKAQNLTELEDLYTPYKSKRKTKALIAKENGLEPLAELLLSSTQSLEEIKKSFQLPPNENIKNFADALLGAQDIIIEKITHHLETKDALRTLYKKEALLNSSLKKDAESIKDSQKFKDYFQFSEPLKNLFSPKNSHRFLALLRGEKHKVLKLSLDIPEETALKSIKRTFIFNQKNADALAVIHSCMEQAYKKNISYSLYGEFFSDLKKHAEEAAISVFGINLKNLLLAPYLGSKAVLGIDPGIRTGCKIAAIDPTGKYLLDHVIYLHEEGEKKEKAKMETSQLIQALGVEYIAIGDGTYGRETLEFIEKNIPEVQSGTVKATLISESGASVYSASEAALEEFPDKDVTVRGAISIARRFQDPLAELVKIDPKSIGVGQYQHDISEQLLKKSLHNVVEDCVNFVGVNINTASKHILSFISGIGPGLSKNITEFRDKNGLFKRREDLLKISKMSEKAFQQSAGFLRIYEGAHPLDSTFVHPERYAEIENWCKKKDVTLDSLVSQSHVKDLFSNDEDLKKQFGEITFIDIIHALKAPTQDPRTLFKSVEFNKTLKTIADIKIGAWYTGVINNITQFGAFVNLGIKESGLIHISQLSDQFVNDPLKIVKVGQEIKVRVLEVDIERKRLSLSCKKEDSTPLPKPKTAPKIQKPQPLKLNKNEFKNKPREPKQKQSFGALNSSAFAALKDLKIKK